MGRGREKGIGRSLQGGEGELGLRSDGAEWVNINPSISGLVVSDSIGKVRRQTEG